MHADHTSSVYVIAEAGVNHNGDRDMAFALVDAAAAAGADCVKFQTFKAEHLVTANAPKAAYQTRTTDPGETQLEMLRRLELGWDLHRELLPHCRGKDIDFLSSPFDRESLAFLVNDLGLRRVKIASGELTTGPLLLDAARFGCEIILSTGMSTISEVAEALAVLAFGYVEREVAPSRDAFRAAYASEDGRRALADAVTLLHCTTEYPAPFEDTNLKALETVAQAFDLRIGLSDHTPGIVVPLAATALGAVVIEKHLTLDRALPGPDQQSSLVPDEFRELVSGIRVVEAALGSGEKKPQPSELANRAAARNSLVALRPVGRGEEFTEANLGVKRPGTGISPMQYWSRLGRRADRDYAKDDLIRA